MNVHRMAAIMALVSSWKLQNPPEVEMWYVWGIHRLKVTSTEKKSAINTRLSAPFSCEYLPSLEHCFLAAIHSRTLPRNFINSLEVCRAVSIACLHIVQVVEVANQESLGKIPLVEWLCH